MILYEIRMYTRIIRFDQSIMDYEMYHMNITSTMTRRLDDDTFVIRTYRVTHGKLLFRCGGSKDIRFQNDKSSKHILCKYLYMCRTIRHLVQ